MLNGKKKKTELFIQHLSNFADKQEYRSELGINYECGKWIQFLAFILIILWFLISDVLCFLSAKHLQKFYVLRQIFSKSILHKSSFQLIDILQMKTLELKKNICNPKEIKLKSLILKQGVKKIEWKFRQWDLKKRKKRKWKLWDCIQLRNERKA